MGFERISGLISKIAIPAVAVIGLSGHANSATSIQYSQQSQLEQLKPNYNSAIFPTNYTPNTIGPKFQEPMPKPQNKLEDRCINPKFVLRENDPRFECLESEGVRNFILSSANYSEKGEAVPNLLDIRWQYTTSEKMVIFAYFPERFSGSTVMMIVSGKKDLTSNKESILEKKVALGNTQKERVILDSIDLKNLEPGIYDVAWAIEQEDPNPQITKTSFKLACIQFFQVLEDKK